MKKWREKHKFIEYLAIMLMGLLCLAGCGKEDNPGSPEQAAPGAQTAVSGAEGLYVNDILMLQFDDPDEEFSEKNCFYDTYGNKLYVLWSYTGQEYTMKCPFLYVFDGETRELERQPFTLQLTDRTDGYIQSMDVRDGGQISFRIKDSEGEFLVMTDMAGNILSRQETFPEDYPWNADGLKRYENRAFDTGDGSVILSRCREQENVTELFLYDVEKGEETPLAVFDGELVRALCMDGADTIYYSTLESINRFSKADNTRTRLLELHENGLSASPVSNNLLLGAQGELLFCELDRGAPCVYVLSSEENIREDELRITELTRLGSDSLARPAKIFFQNNPKLKLVQERCENANDSGIIRERVFMELAANRGPDLMWVCDEDMHVLYEKGLLMDMSELIPEEIKEQIWPGVIRSGTIDDHLVGIKLYALYDTIFVSDALWEGDSWTREDVLELMESREAWNCVFNYDGAAIEPYELLSEVLLTDLDGSEFLDTEQGYCNFDCPEFIRLLETCRKYGQTNTAVDSEEHRTQLETGESIAFIGAVTDGIVGFSANMNKYEGIAHAVGFPTREGGKNHIRANNTYLVVNAGTEHLEEIRELIAYLLSYEVQFGDSGLSVRKDVLENCVTYHEFEQKEVLKLSAAGDKIMKIEVKPDGSSWLPEYLAFLESCEPAPNWQYTMVGAILSEETAPFFAGDKSAGEVARIIQSRVQIYLDESR